MGGGIMFDTNVFISHAGPLPPEFPEWMHRYVVEYEVKQAVQAYLNSVNSPGPSRQVIERCIAACRLLDNLSDEDWDALEPLLADEIGVLHNSIVP
jgi:hypothetical protein